MKKKLNSISLKINTSFSYLPVFISFIEETAKSFSFEKNDINKIILACEEIFVYLVKIGNVDESINIEALNKEYYIEIKFLLEGTSFDPRFFNISTRINYEDESQIDGLGLVIASRTVDRFFLNKLENGTEIILIKEKTYPEYTQNEKMPVSPLVNYSILPPDPEQLKYIVKLINSTYNGYSYPNDFQFPGKIVDMVKSGEYYCLAAVDNSGNVGGGILWHSITEKSIECFGPYIFNQSKDSGISESLMDNLLGTIAKSEALCLISKYLTDDLEGGYFEKLGDIDYIDNKLSSNKWTYHYRQIKEDFGARVWSHKVLIDFLRKEYKRLAFAREITETEYFGEKREEFSVFSTDFDRLRNQVTIRTVWDGADSEKNLTETLYILINEKYSNIFFELDISQSWQSNIIPVLFKNGFEPKIILPYFSKSDLVLLQFTGKEQ